MYLPSAFAEDRLDVLHDLMRRYAFATLVTAGADGAPAATHLPMLLIPQRGELGSLQFHFARPNGHWEVLAAGRPALAAFHGPHAYVSPAWYATAAAVPTWNYMVVHARGAARMLGDVELRGHLRSLAARYESARAEPWDPDRLPPETFDKLAAAVVGFEMEITSLQGKWKLGQNRTRADREGAIAGLRAAGDAASLHVADEMAATLAADGHA